MKSVGLVLVFGIILLSTSSVRAQEGGRIYRDGLSWSPDGKFLSFAAMDRTGSGVYVVGVDGSGLKKLAVVNGMLFETGWAKERIVFNSGADKEVERDIYTIGADGSDLRRLTKNVGRNIGTSLSNDGTRIVFVSNRSPNSVSSFQIYSMRADGSDVRQLTSERVIGYFDPQWSPDGKRIAFTVSKGDGLDQIWVMNADGSNKIMITGGVGSNKSPGWTSDGKRIVFASEKRDGNSEKFLYTVSVDGTGLAPVARIKAFTARYSPDGKKIAYITGGFPESSIYVANADGSGAIKITK
jgi:TolB protein